MAFPCAQTWQATREEEEGEKKGEKKRKKETKRHKEKTDVNCFGDWSTGL